jgi:hypothetical protein
LWYAEGTEQPQGTKGLSLNLLLSLRQCPESTSHSVAKHQHGQLGLLLSSKCCNVERKKQTKKIKTNALIWPEYFLDMKMSSQFFFWSEPDESPYQRCTCIKNFKHGL